MARKALRLKRNLPDSISFGEIRLLLAAEKEE